MNADKNKLITRTEIEQFPRAIGLARARAGARALFGKLDLDGNGQLSVGEFEQMAATPPTSDAGPVLRQLDLNRDGKISLIEYRTTKLANFDRMDADKDGVVSVTEMKTAGLVK